MSEYVNALRAENETLKQQLTRLIKCVDEGLSIEDVELACRSIKGAYDELREWEALKANLWGFGTLPEAVDSLNKEGA